MEENQEHKFVCKICSKNCFSGCSLGGHMRGHLATIAAKKDENHSEVHLGLECGDDIDNSYGLRENPKKTWRIADAKTQCKECGKEFQSMRAVSSHMRCHSIKQKQSVCKQCGKGFGSAKALFGHMRHHTKRSPESQSEYENLCPIRRKRSKLRNKVFANPALCNSNASASATVSEIDELEEAAAMSLIMLSNGVTNLVEFNSILESSEHDYSKIGKAKHDSWKKISVKNESELGELGVLGSGILIRYEKKNELGVFIDGLSEFGELDSGFLIDSGERAELGISNEGSHKISDQFKKFELDEDFESELFGAKIEIENDSIEGKLWDQDDSEMMMKSNSSKGASFDDQDPEHGGFFSDKMNKIAVVAAGFFDSTEKKRAYKCRTCNKIFRSHRALGGHRRGHKTSSCELVVKIGSHERSVESTLMLNNTDHTNSSHEKLECNENLLEEIGFSELKKCKDRECPICFKVFSSGQALGGHKRAHYIGFSDNTISRDIVLAKEDDQVSADLRIVCDLNLPVSLENEVDVVDDAIDVELKPWWVVGSGH